MGATIVVEMQWLPSIKLVTLIVGISIAISCYRQPDGEDAEAELAGEPEQFSATIVRSVDDGIERELSVVHIFKSGELRREEWNEHANSLALIWRPDQGKSYLLDLDRRVYSETDITPGDGFKPGTELTGSEHGAVGAQSSDLGSTAMGRDALEGEAVDRAFDNAPSPVRVETLRLPDQTIDGHPCAVLESREVFANGHIELTTTFRARDLSGLVIRVETGPVTGTSGAKLITRWREIRTDVPSDAFIVPPDFSRVDKLSR